jgi:hypothetical protein
MYGDVVVGGQMLGEDQTSKAPHIAGHMSPCVLALGVSETCPLD